MNAEYNEKVIPYSIFSKNASIKGCPIFFIENKMSRLSSIYREE